MTHETEFDIHCDIADDYIGRHPTTLFSSTPDMSRTTCGKSAQKGYQKGYPDITIADPRICVRKRGRMVYMRVCPGMFLEVKTPSRDSKLTSEQEVVKTALRARGYGVAIPRSVADSRRRLDEYEANWRPLYGGCIEVNLDTGVVKLPRKPRTLPVLPRKKRKKRRKKKQRRIRRKRRKPLMNDEDVPERPRKRRRKR